jgi:hypothetical protein
VVGEPDPLLGIPLTASESAEMARRERIQTDVGAVQAVAGRLDSFAGMYLDQASGAVLTINLTSDATAEDQQLLQAAAPQEAKVTFKTVRYSSAELAEAHSSLQAMAAEQPADQHVGIGAIGTDVIGNVVRVGVVGEDTELVKELLSKFGDRIEIFPDELIQNDAVPINSAVRRTGLVCRSTVRAVSALADS